MNGRRRLGIALAVAGLWLWAACEQTLTTGKVGNTRNAPAGDGTCPAGSSVCGKGAFAQCLDLQNDRDHCGACDDACVAGIGCDRGTCQQIACSGPVSVSAQPVSAVPTASSTCDLRSLLADVNGDGRPDLVTYGCDTGGFQVALGEAGGGFSSASSYQAAAGTIVVANANGDECDDLYLGATNGSLCVQVWLGHPDGRLTPASEPGDAQCYGPTVVADFNGDGTMDMVANSPSLGGFPGVFLADANGAFHEETMLQVSHNGIVFVVRDWNGDGFPDLVNIAQVLSVYLNRGNGTFAAEMECGVFTSEWRQVVVEDFNHDGHFDVAAGMVDSGVGVLMGMGGCQFQPLVEYPLSGRLVNLAYGDVDGDGLGDLAARTNDGGVGSVYLLHGDAGGMFQVSLLSSVGPCADDCSLSLGEVTGDGKVDVVVSGGAQLWIDDGGTRHTVNPTQFLENACP